MNRVKTWKAQGEYKSINTGKPMLLTLDKETGATILEPLHKESYNERVKKEYRETKQRRNEGITFRTWDEVYGN